MRVKIVHSNAGKQDRMGTYAKQLLLRTMESYHLSIISATIKVNHSIVIPSAEFNYHCTLLINMTHNRKIKTEARDCDEILSIYQAVDKAKNIIENQSRS